MYRLMVLGLGVLVTAGPAAAMGEAVNVEHARMNALAGGPTNEYDAWLLKRYGCYSGTRSAFCEDQAYGQRRHRAYSNYPARHLGQRRGAD